MAQIPDLDGFAREAGWFLDECLVSAVVASGRSVES
jgi:hypothetical protein